VARAQFPNETLGSQLTSRKSPSTRLSVALNAMYERFEFPRMCEAVLAKISAYGGVAKVRDLKRDFRNSIRWGNELQRVFDHLIGEESIVVDANLNPGPGPASPGFWLKEVWDQKRK
jgi:hypothetical protein